VDGGVLKRSVRKQIYLGGLVAGLAATASALGAPAKEPSEALFAADRLIEVRITMAPEDWEKLRHEHHDLLAVLGPERLERPEPKPYRTYRAEVAIDGAVLKEVGVRKRGFLGSSSFHRPSLGLRFNEFDKAGRFAGLRRMSLNNNLQDASQIHQALAYRVFALAGVPAPRCNFAVVSVNGKSLGLYSHVEAVEDEFLERHFRDQSGNLYEGRLSDFRVDWLQTFERKNHKTKPGREDLAAVARALEARDAELLTRLGPVLDLDAYLTFWAVESLIGHWDSYSNNGNNFFVYRAPATGKFQFIPWGADSAFGDRDPFTPVKTPDSVKARSLLPYRLYQLPETRERYRERLRAVLKTAWNERELLAEVDRWEKLLKPRLEASARQFQGGLAKVRQFIRDRRAVLEKELAGAAPAWPLPPRNSICLKKAGAFAAEFSTTWLRESRNGEVVRPTARFSLDMDGEKFEAPRAGIITAPSREPRNAGSAAITLLGFGGRGLGAQVPILVVEKEYFRPGRKLAVDGYEVFGLLLGGRLADFNIKSPTLLFGEMELEEAGFEPGDKVTGRVKADIYRMPR